MGFGDYNQEIELYEEYFDFVEKITTTNLFEDPELLNKTALEVYNKLIVEKGKRKLKKRRG